MGVKSEGNKDKNLQQNKGGDPREYARPMSQKGNYYERTEDF